MGPPENEFAAAVGLSALLGRTDDAAVGLTDMRMQGPTTNIDSDQLVLVQQGGGGGERNVNQSYWVAPPEPAIAPPQPPPRPRPSSGWFADPPG